MANDFLHGTETNEKDVKTFSVSTVPTAIIILTGIAPYGANQVLKKVTGTSEAAQFGPEIPGFTIPQALKKIFDEGTNTVIVTNVFNNIGTQTKITAESITLSAGAGTLAHYPTLSTAYATAVPVVTDSAGTTTYVLGTDYTITPFGGFARVGTTITTTQVIKVTYYYLVPVHTTAVSAESQTVTNRAVKTTYAPIIASQAPIVTDSAGTTFYVAGTDYLIDDFGNIKILSASIAEAAVVKITYQKLNTSIITATEIVGAVDGTTGAKTGMATIKDVVTTFGFKPKLLIAPGYSTLSAVVAQMKLDAAKYRALYGVDAPLGTTVAQAIAGRLPGGSINFYTSDPRCVLLYPELKSRDASTPLSASVDIPKPLSQTWAGLVGNMDTNFGFWASPSNKLIQGGTVMETNIEGSLTDKDAENQRLNANGIVTMYNKFGAGLVMFGNRNASFPNDTGIKSFICVRRVADIIEDSVEAATADFSDFNINQAFIDHVRDAVNRYFRSLQTLGAIIDGTCTYDPSKNPPTELAQGHITFDYEFVPPPPAERITYNSTININLLSKLV